MVIFDDLMGEQVPLMLHQAGSAITYTPPGGQGVALRAVLLPERLEDELETLEGRGQRRFREAIISTAAAGEFAGVATPVRNATVTIGATVWSVESIEARTGALSRLRLVREESVQPARDGYMGKR